MDWLAPLKDIAAALKEYGPEAVAAIFILMWGVSDRYSKKLTDDLKDIAIAKVEGDVRTEGTLNANAQALHGVENRLHELAHELDEVKGKISECSGRNLKLLDKLDS